MTNAHTAEVFEGLDPSPDRAARWNAAPNLPDDPSPEQIEAWVELAELATDEGFRQRIREVTGYGIQVQAGRGLLDVGRAQEIAEAARQRGIPPDSAEAVQIVDRILAGTAGNQQRGELLPLLEAVTDSRRLHDQLGTQDQDLPPGLRREPVRGANARRLPRTACDRTRYLRW